MNQKFFHSIFLEIDFRKKKPSLLSMKTHLKVIIALFLVMVSISCRKSTTLERQQEIIIPETELNTLRKSALIQILRMSGNREFRRFVLNECLKQKHGEYNVYLIDIVNSFEGTSVFKEEINIIKSIIPRIKTVSDGREPLIFYPRAETIEDRNRVNTRYEPGNDFSDEVVGVFQDVYEQNDYSSPGFYVTSDNQQLTFFQNITEEYAWENDVWIIGEEESVSPGNMVAEIEDFTLNSARVNGEAEKGGILQVTNMNELEHWTAGKFEFKYFVHNAFGTEIGKRAFGKTKRKYFASKKWHDYNDFIANWNTSNVGNWMIESWLEEDFGSPVEISNVYSAPCTGCPATTIKYTIQSHDEDMGRKMVQFTDSKSQVYNISYSNFKRK